MKLTVAMAAAALAAGCSASAEPEFAPLGPEGVFRMLVPPGMDAEDVAAAARAHCGDRHLCQVMGWMDEEQLPRSFPLTPPQVETLAFMYTRNRPSGFEQSEWDCAIFRVMDPIDCLTEANVVRGTKWPTRPLPR